MEKLDGNLWSWVTKLNNRFQQVSPLSHCIKGGHSFGSKHVMICYLWQRILFLPQYKSCSQYCKVLHLNTSVPPCVSRRWHWTKSFFGEGLPAYFSLVEPIHFQFSFRKPFILDFTRTLEYWPQVPWPWPKSPKNIGPHHFGSYSFGLPGALTRDYLEKLVQLLLLVFVWRLFGNKIIMRMSRIIWFYVQYGVSMLIAPMSCGMVCADWHSHDLHSKCLSWLVQTKNKVVTPPRCQSRSGQGNWSALGWAAFDPTFGQLMMETLSNLNGEGWQWPSTVTKSGDIWPFWGWLG